MKLIGLLGLSVILLMIALRIKPRSAGARLYLAFSVLPLILTIVVPAPFALAVHGPTDWARQTVVAISSVGITLSFILFPVGVLLTLRAARVGDRRAAELLLETVLAGLPAGIVTVYATVFWLLPTIIG